MMLASLLRKHPVELRADFQEVYGLNLDDMGEGYTFLHAADLASMLPFGSRVWRAESDAAKWDDYLLMLNQIDFRLRCIEWGLGGGKGAKPKPIYQPNARRVKAQGVEVDRIEDYLSRARSEDGD